jgi:pimeloyl-ACP methyl ester carboxylesterase
MRIPVSDVALHVVQQGRGMPLLLVHGFPLDHTMWHAQIDSLSASCRVIAPDLRGFGSSDVTAGTVAMERLADDLAELLDVLEIAEPVALCGLSMGGYVAWQFWRRHRHRLGRLILCDTRAAADTPDAAKLRLESAQRVLNEGPGFLADAMIERLFAPATVQQRPELIEATRQTIRNTSPAGIAAALRGMAARPDATGWLPQIDVPTFVLCGQHDAISPPDEMRGMAAQIPAAVFTEIPAAGHMAPLENPEPVNAAIGQFLAD